MVENNELHAEDGKWALNLNNKTTSKNEIKGKTIMRPKTT